MVRLLHMSDLHINKAFENKEKKVQVALKEAMVHAFQDAVDFAIKEAVDLVCIVGDLFDHPFVPFDIINTVTEGFLKLINEKIIVVYTSGNHDPMGAIQELDLLKNSPYFIAFEGDEVKVKKHVTLDGQPLVLVGCGHKSKLETRNLIQTFPRKGDKSIWIGFAHASIGSVGSEERYMPATFADVAQLNYDYFALGHIHLRQKLSDRIAYSGNLQALNIKETGPRGGLLVELWQDGILTKAVNFSKILMAQVDVMHLENSHRLYALEEQVIQSVIPAISESELPANRLILRANLIGGSPVFQTLKEGGQLEALSESVKNKLGLLQFEIDTRNLSPVFDFSAVAEDDTILTEAIGILNGIEERDILKERLLSLPIGDGAMNQKEKMDWVVARKEQLIQEIINRMIKR